MTNNEMRAALNKKLAELKAKLEKINMRNVGAGVLTGVMLATGGAGNVAHASVPASAIVEKDQNEDATLARTRADWVKLFEEFTEIDCNLNTFGAQALLEIEEFLDASLTEEEKTMAFAVDHIIALRHEGIDGISFMGMIEDWRNLDISDEAAKASFIKKYGAYLADLHANNYFFLIILASNIQNVVNFYVRQDVENSEQVANTYGFGNMNFGQKSIVNGEEVIKGYEITPDLSKVILHYTANDGTLYDVDVDIVDSQDPVVGGGKTDFQNVYFSILKEVAAMKDLMVKGEFTENTATYESFAVCNNSVTEINGTEQQVYEIVHNPRINDLVRDGLTIARRFNPAEAYQKKLEAGEMSGTQVTELGDGHYLYDTGDIQMREEFDAENNKYVVYMTEVFEKPQLFIDVTLDDAKTFSLR